MARGMQDSIRALEGRIRAADEEIHRYEEKREALRRLQAQLSELLEGGGELFGLTDDETQLLRRLAEMGAAEYIQTVKAGEPVFFSSVIQEAEKAMKENVKEAMKTFAMMD